MKQTLFAIVFAALVPALFAAPAMRPALTGGVRRHVDHSVFEELPFDDGDVSYILGCEFHDQNGYWQLLLGYTSEVGSNVVDYVVTPQINLILQDRGWQAGVGALSSYIATEASTDWTDIYWQFILGYTVRLPVLAFDILAYYPFESWSVLRDFDGSDIEFGILLRYFY